MRVCLVYDCLFPHTVGGAERWYRNLAERLAADGHEVTLPHAAPVAARRRIRACRACGSWRSGRGSASTRRRGGGGSGRRWCSGSACSPTSRASAARYDVVHTASFPYFGLLAAGALRRRGRYRLVVDWHELWTREYWRDYLGRAGGWVGWRVQRACARLPQRAFCFSRLHAARLAREGVRGDGDRAAGPVRGRRSPCSRALCRPCRSWSSRAATSRRSGCRRSCPRWRSRARRRRSCGPRSTATAPSASGCSRWCERTGWRSAVEVPGFVEHGRVDAALRRALCLVLPSRREGYGLVVVEACAAGTPSVVVADPDNAATELIEEGVNGFVAAVRLGRRTSPRRSCACATAGPALRESTAAWYAEQRAQPVARRLARARGGRLRGGGVTAVSAIVVTQQRRPAARRLPARAAGRARSARPGRGADRGRQRIGGDRRRGRARAARGAQPRLRRRGRARARGGRGRVGAARQRRRGARARRGAGRCSPRAARRRGRAP